MLSTGFVPSAVTRRSRGVAIDTRSVASWIWLISAIVAANAVNCFTPTTSDSVVKVRTNDIDTVRDYYEPNHFHENMRIGVADPAATLRDQNSVDDVGHLFETTASSSYESSRKTSTKSALIHENSDMNMSQSSENDQQSENNFKSLNFDSTVEENRSTTSFLSLTDTTSARSAVLLDISSGSETTHFTTYAPSEEIRSTPDVVHLSALLMGNRLSVAGSTRRFTCCLTRAAALNQSELSTFLESYNIKGGVNSVPRHIIQHQVKIVGEQQVLLSRKSEKEKEKGAEQREIASSSAMSDVKINKSQSGMIDTSRRTLIVAAKNYQPVIDRFVFSHRALRQRRQHFDQSKADNQSIVVDYVTASIDVRDENRTQQNAVTAEQSSINQSNIPLGSSENEANNKTINKPHNTVASEYPVGLSYRSRGKSAAMASALVDPISGRRSAAGAAGGAWNLMGMLMSTANRAPSTFTSTATISGTTVTTGDSYNWNVSQRNDGTLDSLLTNDIDNVTEMFETTFWSSTIDIRSDDEKEVTIKNRNNGDETTAELIDASPAAVTNTIDVNNLELQCNKTVLQLWSFLSVDQYPYRRNHIIEIEHIRHVTALLVCRYTVGLLFVVILLWTSVNTLVLVLMCVVPRWRHRVYSSAADVIVQGPYLPRSRFGFPPLGVRLAINGTVLTAGSARTACFLAGDLVWVFHPWKNGERLSLFGVLFEVVWPLLMASLVAYFIGLTRLRHVTLTQHHELHTVNVACHTPVRLRACTIFVNATAVAIFLIYFASTVGFWLAIEQCVIRYTWNAVHRMIFACLSIAMAAALHGVNRKRRTSGNQTGIGSCSAVVLIALLYGFWTAIDTAVIIVIPFMPHYIRISSNFLWWTGITVQLVTRILELVLCVILCTISMPQSVFETPRKNLGEQRVFGTLMRPCKPVRNKIPASVGLEQFYQLSSKTSTFDKVQRNVPLDGILTVAPHHTTATCRAATTKLNDGKQKQSTWSGKRPRSMLYNDNGFIRFRLDCDPEVDSDARTIDFDNDDYEMGDATEEKDVKVLAASSEDVDSVNGVALQASEIVRRVVHNRDHLRPNNSSGRCPQSASSSLFSFRSPSINLQDSIERELDRCDIWRAADGDVSETIGAELQTPRPRDMFIADEGIFDNAK